MDQLPSLFQMMSSDGFDAGSSALGGLIRHSCAAGQLDEALKAHAAAAASGEVLDVGLYNSLFEGCLQQNRFGDAERLWEAMERGGLAPTDYTLSLFMKLCGRKRQVDRALALVEEFRKLAGSEP